MLCSKSISPTQSSSNAVEDSNLSPKFEIAKRFPKLSKAVSTSLNPCITHHFVSRASKSPSEIDLHGEFWELFEHLMYRASLFAFTFLHTRRVVYEILHLLQMAHHSGLGPADHLSSVWCPPVQQKSEILHDICLTKKLPHICG